MIASPRNLEKSATLSLLNKNLGILWSHKKVQEIYGSWKIAVG